MFIGRLESYYDVIIEELQADKELVHAHDVDALLGERNAEYYELLGKYNKIKATNESLNDALKTKQGIIEELQAEVKRGEEQYHMLASSKDNNNMRNTSLKEYKSEAEAYFDHNPKCKSLLFFMIGVDEFTLDEDNSGCNGISGD